MKINARIQYLACAGAIAGLLAGAITGCGSATQQPPAASASQPAATAGFAGYKWTVVSIGHGGKVTLIPAKYRTYLEFTPNGEFGANEPVNFHSGRYQVTAGGFTTSNMAMTVVGGGGDPVEQLAIDAISALDHGTLAQTRISGDTLTITVNGYTITAQRDGVQANWPVPQQT